tara:strand:- start:75 stop:338 length:264 start_codon:yes stop_codon:yes gene_type:complete
MVEVRMTMEEYMSLMQNMMQPGAVDLQMDNNQGQLPEPGKKKRNTAYTRKYKKAFKKVSSRYKNKSGKWKKGGFKAAVKAAHKEAKK